MKKVLIIGIIVIIIIVASLKILFYNNIDDNIDRLWKSTVSEYIKGDLWDDINCYDAGHILLVPMCYAFEVNDDKKMNEFHDLFRRFADYLENNNYQYKYWDLSHIQFCFLASTYINLCVKNDCTDEIKIELLNYLYDESFFYCLQRREKYNINENPQYNALIAIERDFRQGKPTADLYQYHLSILFNLKEFSDNGNYYISEERYKIIKEALEIINAIYKEGVTFTEGDKWLMNVGTFNEHEDYAYMHYPIILEDMKPAKQQNTTWDTSHFARIPVFLQIFKRANKDNNELVNYYERLIKGLKEQFIENVLIEPNEECDYYRTTNYMDGRNGLYRYNYKTQANTAYQQYELSGTLFLGWWSFLGGDDIKQVYREISKTFPLSQDAINTYVGPNTTRERNSLVRWPDYFENGFAELIVLLATMI